MKLQPGDHVAQKDLTDEQYHAIAKKFMEAGFSGGEYDPSRRMFGSSEYFGISSTQKQFFHGECSGEDSKYLTGRLLTPSQILEDDNGWFERGELPPVGTICEYYDKPTEIVAHIECGGHKKAVYQVLDLSGCGYTEIARCFRPIKSDRDKLIEAACDELKHLLTVPYTAEQNKRIAEHLAKAGLLKLPEGDK